MESTTKITFEFRQYKDSWPICIAKIEDYTFICLDLKPQIYYYAKDCGDLIDSFLDTMSYPCNWEVIFHDNYFSLKEKMIENRIEAGMPATENLPF